MRPPPLLLGVALLFWGWQSDLLPVGALLAVILESARVIHRRWEFSDEDFARLWTLCSLLFLGSAIYAFTANDGPAAFSGYLENPSMANQRNAGGASSRTAAAMFRWLPMIFFPFIAAQAFSTRETIPLATISFVIRRRARKAKATGQPVPRTRQVQLGYPYLIAVLLGASVHPLTGNGFFWGLVGLLAWALWALRPRRFHVALWAGTLGAAITLGFFGQAGIGNLQSYLERLNPAWLQRFLQRGTDFTRSRTAIGRIGELKLSGKIVIRVVPRAGHTPPEYLREASYRAYRGETWFAGTRRESFEGSLNEDYPNSRSWDLRLPPRPTNYIAQIACSIPGGKALLPLPTGVTRMENLAAYVLAKNDLGAILCQGPGLVVFDAHFGPGETLDSLPNDDDRINLPVEELAALNAIAEELQLGDPAMPAREAMRRVRTFFAEKFTYSTYQEAPRDGRRGGTPLARFLRETHRGHCEYFATATTLLLRRARVPARYAVGYYVHERSGDNYVVRLRDAHAWCLVWDEQIRQWVNFDTTPASWTAEEAKLQSTFQWLSDAWARFTFELAKFRWGQSRVREYLFLLIVPGLVVLVYQIVTRRRRPKPNGVAADADRVWPGLDSEFYRLEAALTARGFPRAPGDSLGDWLERATESAALLDLRPPLRQLLHLHYRHRFDPAGLSAAERHALREEARTCLENLTRRETSQAALPSRSD